MQIYSLPSVYLGVYSRHLGSPEGASRGIQKAELGAADPAGFRFAPWLSGRLRATPGGQYDPQARRSNARSAVAIRPRVSYLGLVGDPDS